MLPALSGWSAEIGLKEKVGDAAETTGLLFFMSGLYYGFTFLLEEHSIRNPLHI
jgi:hypothetical protein